MQGPAQLSNLVVGRLADCQGQGVSSCVRTIKRVRTCRTLFSDWKSSLESNYVNVWIDEVLLRD